MTGKGRGRGNQAQQQQQQQSAPAPRRGGRGGPSYAQMGGGHAGAPQPQAAKPPAPSAWGPPPGASSRATHRPPAAQPGGDVAAKMGELNLGRAPQQAASGGRPAAPSGGSGNGNGGPAGRGAIRGRRPIGGEPILRTRPAHLTTKQGTEGLPCKMFANYFRIKTVPDWALHQYRVDIAPEEDRTGERKYLLRAHKEKLGGYLFDGTVLYTTVRITSPQNPVLTLTSANRDNSSIFIITIKEVGEVQKGDFAYVQIYNLLLRTCISGLELQLVGRDYYDAKAKVQVPQFRLELWPGYKTSIRQHESDILMCVEITHKVMRMETVLDLLNECYRNRGAGDYQRDFVKEVVGCIVLTKYNNKTYRIDDVAWDLRPTDTFKYRNEEINYINYMQQKYQITIKDVRQPLLVSRAKARDLRAGMQEVVNLIPEVCFCTGLTDNMRANFQLMKALAVHTRVGPDNRVQKLKHFNNRLQRSEQAMEQLKRFDMTLDRDLVKINGRTNPVEKIIFGGGKTVFSGVDWTKDLTRGSSLLCGKDLKNWVLVVPQRWVQDSKSFVGMLKRAAGGMKFNLDDPKIYEIGRDSAPEYLQALTQILDQMHPQLIMLAVPNNRGDRYSAIKKKCCVDKPVPTQVILCKNLNDPKKSMSVATKVAIQMNCKIGGSPWGLEIPLLNLMVVGFDVCHDTNSKNQSFGAMVASLDRPMSRYFSAVTPHSNGEELSNNLAINIVKAARKYHQVNGAYPARILIFRDGVGEGQIPFVVTTELEQVKQKLAEAYAGAEVRMTFVIVTKRVNTRLFTDDLRNPAPGSVVDDVITDPEKYDFFLVSQSVKEGSVSPTSYNVVWDELALPPERLQRLAYKMCHLYFNWSGTVRVPAPCQYAHKLAFLVGQALHREPSAALDDLLYFL